MYHSRAQSVGCSWDVRGRETPCRPPRSMEVEVGGSLEDRTRATRTQWGASGGERAENEKKKSWRRWGGGAVGVPSYLVIYSPRAPGYPSRGITQGWAHRTPKMSLLRGAPDTPSNIYVQPTFEFHACSIPTRMGGERANFASRSRIFSLMNNFVSDRFPSQSRKDFFPKRVENFPTRVVFAFPSKLVPRTIVRDK